MITFWIEIGFALLLILIVIILSIKFSKEKDSIDDEKALKITRDELYQDGFDYFELESITSLDKTTTVIVKVGFQEIALEIDNTGKIISKERIARQ